MKKKNKDITQMDVLAQRRNAMLARFHRDHSFGKKFIESFTRNGKRHGIVK